MDGGGMRGLYTATVLETITQHFAARRRIESLDIGNAFDLLTGTSTGGILAAALAAGLPLGRIIALYREEGPKIFTDPMPSGWRLPFWLIRNRKKAANSNARLKVALDGFFGGETLKELFERRRVRLCIPAVQAEHHLSKVFKTPHLERLTRDRNYKLADVCLATSAAPVYLPLAQFTHPDNPALSQTFADGGLWANNPVLVGLVEALEIVGDTRRPIEILSVGTCPVPEGGIIMPGHGDWGLEHWKVGAKVAALAMNSQAYGHASMAKLLADRFTALGQAVNVVRLESPPRSPEQMKHMTLDGSHPEALHALTQAAVQDAEAAIRQGDGGGSPTAVATMLNDLFMKAPAYQKPPEEP